MEHAASTPAGILDAVVREAGCVLGVIATRQGDYFLVEEASPDRRLAGARLRIPPCIGIGPSSSVDTATLRLPLDWTMACEGRPDYLVSAAVGQDERRLVLAGFGALPDPALLAQAGERLATLLAAGQGTRRDETLARHVRVLVDHLPYPVVFIDSRSSDALVNDPARLLLSIGKDDANPENVPAVLRALVAAAAGDATRAFSNDPDDQIFDLATRGRQYEVTIRPIDREPLSGRLWVFRDVTIERESTRFRDELIANVSHELRTPITGIFGAIALLAGTAATNGTPNAQRLLAIASANAKRLTRLVDDLLDAGKLDAHGLEIMPRPVDLGWLLADTIELSRSHADRLGIEFAFDRPVQPCIAAVDPDRMAQVLGNVLSNAAKFSRQGDVVHITLEADSRCARIAIVDQGCGMTPQFQKRLFTRFAREREGAGNPSGTGLGLTIAKGILEAMSGSIEIESAQGEGTTVRIGVPLATSTASDDDPLA